MTFPLLQEITQSTDGEPTQGTSHTVDYPSSVDAGDLLLLIFGSYTADNSANQTHTTPTGYTLLDELLYDGGTQDNRLSVYAKKADGTEGGTSFEVTVSDNVKSCAQIWRFKRWHGTISGGVEAAVDFNNSNGATNNPDPSSLTPSWGAEDNTWICCMLRADDQSATVSSYPSDYSSNQTETRIDSGNDDSFGIAQASRNLNAATENPGTYTLSESEGTIAGTIAVRGADQYQLVKSDLALDAKTLSLNVTTNTFIALVQGDLALDPKTLDLGESHFKTLVQGDLVLDLKTLGLSEQTNLTLVKGNLVLDGKLLQFNENNAVLLQKGDLVLDPKTLTGGVAHFRSLVQGDLTLDPKTMSMGEGYGLVQGNLVLDGKLLDLDEVHNKTLVQGDLALSSKTLAATVLDLTQLLSGNVKGQKTLTGNVKAAKTLEGTIE